MATSDEQMRWIVRNRQWPRLADSLGTILQRERQRAPLKVPPWHPRVVEVVQQTVDEDFTQHVCMLKLRGGVLTIHMDDPVVLGVARMKWHRPLRQALAGRLSDLSIVDVRFRLAEPPEPAAPPANVLEELAQQSENEDS